MTDICGHYLRLVDIEVVYSSLLLNLFVYPQLIGCLVECCELLEYGMCLLNVTDGRTAQIA